MKITKRKLSELKSPEKNVRRHTDKQITEFVRSITMFGQIRPIVIDENGVILAGNGLHEALVKMGATEADCYVAEGLSENEKKKLMLADNRIFNLGVDDIDAFDAIIAELSGDLDIPGFDDSFLASLVMDDDAATEALSEYGRIDADEAESIRRASVQYEAPSASETPMTNPSPATSAPAAAANTNAGAEEDVSDRPFVICPRCGEKIWL